jgi:hypothetical protein
MDDILASVKYKDNALYERVRQAADKKFSGNSYVKNLWILNEYKRRGGKVSYTDKKPSRTSIKKSIKGKEEKIVVNYSICEADLDCGSEEEVSEVKAKEAKKKLNKPFRTPGGPKKFSVYVKNDKGNIVKVNFGDPNMSIKRDDPERRRNFRARHGCDNPGPKWKARYWSCKFWSKPSVTSLLSKEIVEEKGEQEVVNWQNLPTQEELFGS